MAKGTTSEKNISEVIQLLNKHFFLGWETFWHLASSTEGCSGRCKPVNILPARTCEECCLISRSGAISRCTCCEFSQAISSFQNSQHRWDNEETWHQLLADLLPGDRSRIWCGGSGETRFAWERFWRGPRRGNHHTSVRSCRRCGSPPGCSCRRSPPWFSCRRRGNPPWHSWTNRGVLKKIIGCLFNRE